MSRDNLKNRYDQREGQKFSMSSTLFNEAALKKAAEKGRVEITDRNKVGATVVLNGNQLANSTINGGFKK